MHMFAEEKPAGYHPRTPQQSPIWTLHDRHCGSFEGQYQERFARSYGFFRLVVRDVVKDYLKCGDLREGFARVRCPDCRHGTYSPSAAGGAGSAPAVTAKRGSSLAST